MKRALLVIDVQREYFDGALPISHPVGHLETILDVMDEARRSGVPAAVVRHHQPDPDSPIFRQGSEMWRPHPEVARRPNDRLIDKRLPGCFTGTDLESWPFTTDLSSIRRMHSINSLLAPWRWKSQRREKSAFRSAMA